MKKISKDDRHKNVIKLYEGVKAGRYFKEWSMALIDNSPSFFKDQKAIKFLNPEISGIMFNIIYKYLAKFREFFIKLWTKFNENDQILINFAKFYREMRKKFDDFFLEYRGLSGAKACKS